MTIEHATSVNLETVIQRLRAELRGQVVTPGDPDYDAMRCVMYGGLDARPAVIARPVDAEDVAAAVTIARETGVPLAIRSGGHSGAGHSTVADGLVIDLRELHAIEIDPVTKTAWVGAGATAIEVTTAGAEHGLAIGFGDTGSVGVGGITLGGGVGYLARKWGLSIDNLLAADIVTADGRVVRADADTNPDLFWAIRGGGGNFGVATRFRFRLHDLPAAYGGLLILPATAETIARFIEVADAAPDEVSTIANVMGAPPMPFLPEDVVGTTVIFALIVAAADEAAGAAALAPFRAIATPIADMLKPMAYAEIFGPEDPDYHPTAVSRNLFVDRIDEDVARTILDFLDEAADAPVRAAQLRVLGGASARVPNDATAYAHRDEPIMVNLAAFYEGEADRERRQAWLERFATALDQGSDGVYVNFLLDEGEGRIRAAYPDGAYERLAEIKARWDPTNLFQRNQNIPPA